MNLEKLGLKEGLLYEIIATTLNKKGKDITFNSAPMGIRVLENGFIEISPYLSTQTYRNLKENGLISLNLIENVFFYALTALKLENRSNFSGKLNEKLYESKEFNKENIESNLKKNNITKSFSIPYLKDSWGVIFCVAIEEKAIIKKDVLGSSNTAKFLLKPLLVEKIKESHKLINRAENIAIEIIILATRLKVAKKLNNKVMFEKILKEINKKIEYIKRFCKNEDVFKTIKHVQDFINIIKN
ncbi:MAG: DUF447 domain-containing protein [Promethearchaeota archaeon]